MYKVVLSWLFIVQFNAIGCIAQEILELRYCVLFDTYQEKQVFNEWQQGKKVDVLFLLTAFDTELDSSTLLDFTADLEKSLSKLKGKKVKHVHPSWWVRKMFYRLHSIFLRQYHQEASFADLVQNGRYNCLSGTLLYAYALEYLEVPYVMYETDHHMFLRLFLEGQTWVLDATDPLEGIKREARLHFPAAASIDWSEAIGLQYFNLAVESFEDGNYLDALRSLRKARLFYPSSERIKTHMHYIFSLYEQHEWLSLEKN